MAKEDLGEQLAVQQQINKVLAQRQALMAKQTQVLGAQVKIAATLCDALDCKGLDGMNDRLQEINDSLNEVADTAEEAADATEGLADAAGKASSSIGDNSKSLMKLGAGVGLLKGVQAGFSGIMSTLSGLGSGLVSVVGSVFKLGKTLLSVPIKIWSGLIGMAQGGGGGPNPIKVALEEVRKEMGSLNSNEGKAFKDSLGVLRSEMKSVGGTGVSMAKMFGRGREGFAEALKYNAETAKALGSAFSALSDEFAKAPGKLAAYRKGLGLTAEQMGALGKRALSSGKSMQEVAREVTSYAVNMEKDFGYSSKLISKDMGKMMEDFDHFGTLGPKVMSQIAVQTRRLGIEVKELTGLVDKFDNFEDAAKGAAELAQSFGMNVDAMKMMKEQDPAARLSMMQKSFKATGKSVESMNRQELKRLSTLTGMSAEATKLAFSQKGLGMSYDDVQKAGGKNEKKQLSQAEAMSKLADSIERVFGSGGGKKFKGFFDAFAQGFGKGIKKSAAFRKVMRNIRKSLRVVFKAGKRVGKLFVKMFPGVKKMLGGLAKLFNPKDVKKLMNGVVKEFKNFFKIIQDDPQAGVATLIERLKEKFKEFFGKKGDAANDVKEGGKVFLKTLFGIFKGLLMIVIPLLTKGIKKLTEIIKNPAPVTSAFSEVMSALWKALGELFGELFSKLGPPLWKALKGMFLALAEKAKPFLKKYWPMVVGALLMKGLMVAILSMLKGGAVAGAFGLLFKGIAKLMGKTSKKVSKEKAAYEAGRASTAAPRGAVTSLRGIGSGEIAKAAGKIFIMAMTFLPAFITFVTMLVAGLVGPIAMMGNPVKFAVGVWGISQIIYALKSVFMAASKLTAKEILATGAKFILMAFGLIAGLLAFVVGLMLVYSVSSSADWGGIAVMMLGVGFAMAAVGVMLAATKLMSLGDIASGALKIAAASLVLLALIPFSFVMTMLVPILKGFSPAEMFMVGLTMIGLAVALVGVAAVSLAATLLQPSMIIPAAMGLLTAIPLVILIGLFSAILYGIANASGFLDLDWNKMGNAFKNLGIVFLAIAAITVIAAMMNPMTMLFAAVGLLAASAFVWLITKVFVAALNLFGQTNIDFLKIAVNFVKLVPITLALALVGIMMIPAGMIGFVASFFVLGASLFVYAIVKSGLVENLNTMGKRAASLKNTKSAFEAITEAMKSLVMIAAVAFLLLPIFLLSFFGPSFGTLAAAINGFLKALLSPGGVIDNIKKMVGGVPNPEGAKQAAEAMKSAVGAIAGMAEVALDLGKLELEAFDEGYTGSILDKVKGLMDVIMKGMTGPNGILSVLVTLSTTMPPGGIDQIKAVAGLLDSLAKLFGGLLGPVAELMQVALSYADEGVFGNDVDTAKLSAIMAEISSFVTGMLTDIREQIGPMISDLISIEIPGDPRDVEPKIKIMAQAIEVMSKVSSMMAEQGANIAQMNKTAGDSKRWYQKKDSLGKTIGQMGSIMNMLMSQLRRHVPQLIAGLVGLLNLPALKGDPKQAKVKMDMIGVAMKAVADAMVVMDKAAKMAKKTKVTITKKGAIKVTGPLVTAVTVIPMIGRAVKSAVESITGVDIGPDPEMAKKKVQVVGKAMKVVTEMLNAISGLMGTAPKSSMPSWLKDPHKKDPPDRAGLSKAQKAIKDLVWGMKKIIEAITAEGGGIATAVGAITKIAEGPAFNDPESMKMKMEVIIKAIKVVTEFTKAIGDSIKISGAKNPAAMEKDINLIFGPGGMAKTIIKRIIGGEKGELYGIPDIVNAVMKSANKINDPAGAKKKMDIVVAAVGAVSKFASMLSSMIKLAGPGLKTAKETREAVTAMFEGGGPVYEIISRIAGQKGKKIGMPYLVNKILDVAKEVPASKTGIKKKVELIGSVMGAIATFADVIQKMIGMMPKPTNAADLDVKAGIIFGGGGTIYKILSRLTGEGNKIGLPEVASKIVLLFKGGKKGGALKNILRYSKQIKTLGVVFDSIGKFVDALVKLKDLGSKGSKAGEYASVSDNMGKLATVFDTSAGKEGGFTKLVNGIANFSKNVLKGKTKALWTAGHRFKGLIFAMKGAADVASFGGEGYGKGKKTMSKSDVDSIAKAMKAIADGNLVTNINTAFTTGLDKNVASRAAVLRKVLNSLDGAVNQKYLGDMSQTGRIVSNIEKLGGLLTGDSTKAVTVMKAFKGGKLSVKHNIPAANIEVVVSLDGAPLAKKLSRVKFDGTKQLATK